MLRFFLFLLLCLGFQPLWAQEATPSTNPVPVETKPSETITQTDANPFFLRLGGGLAYNGLQVNAVESYKHTPVALFENFSATPMLSLYSPRLFSHSKSSPHNFRVGLQMLHAQATKQSNATYLRTRDNNMTDFDEEANQDLGTSMSLTSLAALAMWQLGDDDGWALILGGGLAVATAKGDYYATANCTKDSYRQCDKFQLAQTGSGVGLTLGTKFQKGSHALEAHYSAGSVAATGVSVMLMSLQAGYVYSFAFSPL